MLTQKKYCNCIVITFVIIFCIIVVFHFEYLESFLHYSCTGNAVTNLKFKTMTDEYLDETTGEYTGAAPIEVNENCVMVSGLVPMVVEVDGNPIPIYVNKDVNSALAFRPNRMKFEQENKHTVKIEDASLKAGIKKIADKVHWSDKHGISFVVQSFLTMVDSGYVIKVFDIHASKCRVCVKTMGQFRSLQQQGIVVDYENPGSLDYGGSPTHTTQHVGHLLLDLGARSEFEKHGKQGYSEMKKEGDQRMHDEILKFLGLHVNEARAGRYLIIFYISIIIEERK